MFSAPVPPPAPAVSISVTDGQGTARTDARLGYVVTVRNEGSVPLRGLRLEQRVPGPAGGLTAGQGGSAHGDVVSWTVDLPGRTSRRFHVEAVVGRSASSDAQQSRLVVTACAFPVGDRMPGVCATDLDRLAVSARSVPAAGGEPSRRRRASPPPSPRRSAGRSWYCVRGRAGSGWTPR
ncbi:hypothetical protein ACFQZC_28325 [Streptacidiphilus monticola]